MQTMPPAGMQKCGNFSWTVEEFKAGTRRRSASNDPHLSDGTIAGIVIAAIICLIIIIAFIVLIILLCLRNKGNTSKKGETSGKSSDIKVDEAATTTAM